LVVDEDEPDDEVIFEDVGEVPDVAEKQDTGRIPRALRQSCASRVSRRAAEAQTRFDKRSHLTDVAAIV
jgi:hypothetical protein